ncbi:MULTISPECIES: DUF4238 domain-containing protein [Gammaproteobacteria]|uniref:DUF4238 domain-containing protein n=1 Tax=Gammaproteobacteria TaxID=1236 RepID=UPI001B83F57B|nr:DUF4238 domain-containing protein [Pseudomonas juntendi]
MDNKFYEVKKKHHYVWANYLKRWSVDGVNAYHSTKKGFVVSHGIRGIAMEPNLYKITTLTDLDIHLIRLASSKSAPEQNKLHMGYLNDFLKFQRVVQIYKASGTKDADTDRAIKALESRLLEDLHSSHEKSVIPIFDSLANGRIEVLYKNSNLLEFMSFIGHQFARTKTFRDRVILGLDRSTIDHARVAQSMKNSWWFISYMLGMNLARDLYLNRLDYTHSLLEAPQKVEFITSDQPVINIHEQVWRDGYREAEFIDYYYPISPRYAYVVAQSDSFSGGLVKVSDSVVNELNKKISATAASSIIGSTPESIRPLVRIINSKHPSAKPSKS